MVFGRIDPLFEHLFAVVDHLIAQQLNRLAQGKLQVFRHAVGMAVAVFIQVIQQGAAFGGAGVLAVQQGGGGQQGAGVTLVEQLLQVKAQQARGAPLVAIDQHHLIQANQDHPAGRVLQGKNRVEQIFEGGILQNPGFLKKPGFSRDR